MHIFDILYDFSGTFAFLMTKIPVQTWNNEKMTFYYCLYDFLLLSLFVFKHANLTIKNGLWNGYTNIIYITFSYQWMHNIKSVQIFSLFYDLFWMRFSFESD